MAQAGLTPEERFWSHAAKGEGCWLWTGARRSGGYGTYRFGSRIMTAHRLAWELAYGPMPGDARSWAIGHRCGSKRCVRHDHLLLLPVRPTRERSVAAEGG